MNEKKYNVFALIPGEPFNISLFENIWNKVMQFAVYTKYKIVKTKEIISKINEKIS